MKLTPENYYSQEANRAYMSGSQYKDFLKCEAAAMAKLNGEYTEPQQDCFLLGSYVHAKLDGTIEQFIAENPSLFSSKGQTKGELKADYKNADVMYDTLMTDPLCSSFLEGQHEVIVTAELFGVPWKAKIDVLAADDGRIVDLKTVKNLHERYWHEGGYKSFVESFGYVLQMSIYTELERLANRRFERLEPFIVAVSKEDVPDKAVICFDEEALENERQKVALNIGSVMDVKEGRKAPRHCGKCRYCRQTKKAEIIHYLNLVEVV